MEQKKANKQPVPVDRKQRYKSLIIDGRKYRTYFNHKFENRKEYKVRNPYKIISYIPGTVLKLTAKEGQEVHKGDTALILDAMKMKNRILFERGGIVRAVHVKEGEKVPKDCLMIELSPLPG
jgi:biotin carboxyl carrier protein